MMEPSDEALSRVVESCRRAVDDVPPNFEAVCGLFTTVASIYIRIYDKSSEVRHLNKALALAQKALDNSPIGVSETRATCASNLAGVWYRFFLRTGLPGFLDLELDTMGKALDSVPSENTALQAMMLFNIGAAYMLKYEGSSDIDDFKRAADRIIEAADRLPVGHIGRAVQIANLGSVLGQRFQRVSHDIRDLERAISRGEDAVKLTPLISPFYASRVVRLGLNLELLYKEAKTPVNLDRYAETFDGRRTAYYVMLI